MTPPVALSIDRLIRENWGRLLAVLTARLGDYALAEDSLQDAVVEALSHWPKSLPRHPDAWLLTVARRKALDRLRRAQTASRKEGELALWLDQTRSEEGVNMGVIPDHRLELIFTCCHPALEEKTRTALTLRAIGGLTTAEIAAAYLDKPETMAARLTRAKQKIQQAGIPFRLPDAEDLPERLNAVLRVIYLIFNEGFRSSGAELTRADLVGEAIRLGRILACLLPADPEVKALLALMLLGDSRRLTRMDEDGAYVPLELQNRARWDKPRIREGITLVKQALGVGPPGPYALQAAISALHAEAPDFDRTDWAQIVALYDLLLARHPNPVVHINRAVALSYLQGPDVALAQLDGLPTHAGLGRYQPFHACRADLLARLGRAKEAADHYRQAIDLTTSVAEKTFLSGRMAALPL
ncbi:RNA polymerase sigma factor [Aliiroseovarius crassostreae]|uniref:RNA polymerase sigma factor n=1 Tax=Aliiroseovarius crassostreae TaxID=154981 RepID=UPI0021AFCAE1|nr:sigma-70 family RNA polymerase sigma factor [Aliiroseovarius crassostreae]UWP88612.1 sigma-70 family RNA polymerase sigma factor [Aliiroseovarius crassostreae]